MERDILYQKGDFWVIKAKFGYEIYRDGITHASRCSIMGYEGEEGLQKTIKECDRRYELSIK